MCYMTERKTQMNGLMKMIPMICLLIAIFCPPLVLAQLVVIVSPPKFVAQKAKVQIAMQNNFTEKIVSARAGLFLVDGNGHVIGQSTKWVIGGSPNIPGLAPGDQFF